MEGRRKRLRSKCGLFMVGVNSKARQRAELTGWLDVAYETSTLGTWPLSYKVHKLRGCEGDASASMQERAHEPPAVQ